MDRMLVREIIKELREWNVKEFESILKDTQIGNSNSRSFAKGKVEARVELDVLLSKYEEAARDEEVATSLKLLMDIVNGNLSTADLTYWFDEFDKPEDEKEATIDPYQVAYKRLDNARNVVKKAFGL